MIRGETLLALGMFVTASAASAAEPSAYVGWQARTIKALSAQQIEDYLEGRGMAMALPAELNGYPGPRHALELADELGLTPDQLKRTWQLFDDMRLIAIELGAEIVECEATLDELFASGTATEAAVHRITQALGRLSEHLRAHHLSHHLAMRAILDPHQVHVYQRLRGYTAAGGPGDGHGHFGHGGASRKDPAAPTATPSDGAEP